MPEPGHPINVEEGVGLIRGSRVQGLGFKGL